MVKERAVWGRYAAKRLVTGRASSRLAILLAGAGVVFRGKPGCTWNTAHWLHSDCFHTSSDIPGNPSVTELPRFGMLFLPPACDTLDIEAQHFLTRKYR